jgi:NADPH-dependent 2,4-dienoyl-CoA reductase/sulfur reductase-like enzyme
MSRERHYDVLVVGAGPAGLAAAWAAAQGVERVGLVDENQAPGGQIWRGEADHGRAKGEPGAWFQKVAGTAVEFLPAARVIALPRPGHLSAETPERCLALTYRRLIMATGARERFLPFPGWTLPNVLGAGGLQALVKSGLRIQGKTVVVAGSGPLLLAVAAYLRSRRAEVRLIAEQADRSSILRFGLRLIGSPAKMSQALRLKLALRGVPYRTGCWPVSALGEGRLTGVTLTDGRTTWYEPCDYLACGFDLIPNTELARALGCETRQGGVVVDDWQQTTVEGVYCAGEATGVGGLEKSLTEGRIAGHAAGGQPDAARALFSARKKSLSFANSLATAFALRDELRALPHPDTIVCRCEDVSWARILPHGSPRAAKLQTRCGMGPCQGRVCGPAIEFLMRWPLESVRPPIFPARLESLTDGARCVADLTQS